LTIDEGKEDVNILAVIEGADYKTLTSLHKQYDEATDNEFGFVCQDCDSHNVTRASADPDAGGEGDEKKEKTRQQVIEKFTGVNTVTLPSWMKEKKAE